MADEYLQNGEGDDTLDDLNTDSGMESEDLETDGQGSTGGEGDEDLGTSDEKQQIRKPASEDIQKVINRKHFQYHEEKRKREALEKENRDLKAKLAPAAPEIPAIPDAYDPEFVQKMAKRDEVIHKRAMWEAQQKPQTPEVPVSASPDVTNIQALEKVYVERMTKLGITQQESVEQQNTILPFLSPQLAGFILEAEDGPLITKYLSENAVELIKISEMGPVGAGAYITRHISPKAAKLSKRQISNAPDPVKPAGQGASNAASRTSSYMKGVILE